MSSNNNVINVLRAGNSNMANLATKVLRVVFSVYSELSRNSTENEHCCQFFAKLLPNLANSH